MSSFTKPLSATRIGKREWVTDRSFKYYVGSEDSGECVTVPKGFLTDFASVPRAFWIIFPPDGEYTQAAVLHDYLYYMKGCIKRKVYTRLECDKIFLEAMGVLGVPWVTRHSMYRAVRLFGWVPWGKRSEEVYPDSELP